MMAELSESVITTIDWAGSREATTGELMLLMRESFHMVIEFK